MRHGLLDGSFVGSLSAMTGTRDGAIERAENYFDNGGFQSDLQRRVAIPTTSQEEGSMLALQQYLAGEMGESLQKLGYDCTVLPNSRTEPALYSPFRVVFRLSHSAVARLRPTMSRHCPSAATASRRARFTRCLQRAEQYRDHSRNGRNRCPQAPHSASSGGYISSTSAAVADPRFSGSPPGTATAITSPSPTRSRPGNSRY